MKIFGKTNKRLVMISALFMALTGLALAIVLVAGNMGDFNVLSPKGKIAADEKNLIIFGTLLSLIVVLPVFAMTIFIAWKYRAGNKKAKYRPDFDRSRLLESIWWGVPLILIIILSVVTVKSSHDLDPSKPLAAEDKQLTIQVVSMNWKWLFIYPEENIATVNHIQIPIDQPVEFQITGDSAMNSFWIPSLGGQIYAMAGMSTLLHLQADKVGEYRGSSANISGQGFSGMKFTVKATSREEFNEWVKSAQKIPQDLTSEEYEQLSQPSVNHPPVTYGSADDDLYANIIRKYVLPQ